MINYHYYLYLLFKPIIQVVSIPMLKLAMQRRGGYRCWKIYLSCEYMVIGTKPIIENGNKFSLSLKIFDEGTERESKYFCILATKYYLR